jgi:hypothetical protein
VLARATGRTVASSRYEPRRAEDSVLYGIVQEHLATFLSHVRETYDAPLPRYVEDAFRAFLACGIFGRGFCRCHCDACGLDVLVPYSCKNRGVCPSCGARRTANLAAHLVDRVLPNVPIRQWVLSLPFELRAVCAKRPDVLTAMGRIFYEAVASEQKAHLDLARSEAGAISFPQRFGGSLNAHVHYHCLVLDGLFVREGKAVRFHEAPPPTRAQIERVARRVRDRAVRWLGRHGHLDERAAEDRGDEPGPSSPIDACLQLALCGGTLLAHPPDAAPADPDALDFERSERRFWASCDDFDVECSVRVGRDEDERRERLVRYCARPPLSLDRVELLHDGRIAYRLKTARNGRTHRVMTPLEFLARLSALVPPPRFPLLRYHGVLGPRSRWRALVVPRPPRTDVRTRSCPSSSGRVGDELAFPSSPAAPAFSPETELIARALPNRGRLEPPFAPSYLVPNVITVRHWDRLLDGELLATQPRVDWPTLMRRTFGFDVTVCPNCHGRMRVLSAITDAVVAKRILDHLGVPSGVPEVAPARDPTWEPLFSDDPTTDTAA